MGPFERFALKIEEFSLYPKDDTNSRLKGKAPIYFWVGSAQYF